MIPFHSLSAICSNQYIYLSYCISIHIIYVSISIRNIYIISTSTSKYITCENVIYGWTDRSICLHRLHSAVAKFPGEFISMGDRHFSLSTLFFSSIHHIQHRHPRTFDCFIFEFDPANTPPSPQRCPPHLNRERSQSSAVDPLVRDKFPYPHDD